jgi:elongation factor Ts
MAVKISAKMVKDLREATTAPMMDCKKALVESEGDFEKAKEILRDKGISKSEKKADRVAAEGLTQVSIAGDFASASVIEINSETDFVAKNENFQKLVKEAVDLVQSTDSLTNENNMEDLKAVAHAGKTFGEYFTEETAKIGEKIDLRRFKKITADVVGGYAHTNGRVAVVIGIKTDKPAELQTIAKNIAMHAASMKPVTLSYKDFDISFVEEETKGRIEAIKTENEELSRLGKPLKNVPQYISMIQLTDEVIEKAKDDIKEQLKAEKKPEKIWDKILPGKLDRFIADNTTLDKEQALLDQNYVMDDSITVAQALEAEAKKVGATAEIVEYIRFELGEGIEKKEAPSFADEVASQMK